MQKKDFKNKEKIIKEINNKKASLLLKNNEEIKNNENNIVEVHNKIKFKSDIKTSRHIFTKDELNFILEFLFYFKKKGTIIAHPNIDPEENIQLKTEEKYFKTINNIINDNSIQEREVMSENEYEKEKETIIKNAKLKLKLIKDEIINYFMEFSSKKEINVSDITNFMLFGNKNVDIFFTACFPSYFTN